MVNSANVAGDRQRREHLLDIRMDLHRQRLETLNLAALDRVAEGELRREIASISREGSREMGVVLNAGEME